jgi:hypothetical protein
MLRLLSLFVDWSFEKRIMLADSTTSEDAADNQAFDQ